MKKIFFDINIIKTQFIPEENDTEEKTKLAPDPVPNVDQTVAAVKSLSKPSRGIPKIKTTKPKPIKAVKQYSLDSLPDLPDIDVFDRAKTPDPRAPATLIHQLKDGDSCSETYNVIEKYYASKNEEKSDVEDDEDSSNVSQHSLNLNKGSNLMKVNDESKRNAVLFPDMTQDEIDARILEICQNR